MKIATKLILAFTTSIAFNTAIIFPAITKEIDRNTLCTKFPLNSRCKNFQLSKPRTNIYQLNRRIFCKKFPLNSQCQKSPVEIIKLNLDRSGENDEWIRIKKQDNKIKLLHTTRVKDGLVSGALDGAVGALIPIPLPYIEANKYGWEDHPITKVTYQRDNCKANNCIVIGKDTIILPPNADIYGGLFTIEYREKELKRSLTFRIPLDTKAEIIDTITVKK